MFSIINCVTKNEKCDCTEKREGQNVYRGERRREKKRERERVSAAGIQCILDLLNPFLDSKIIIIIIPV